MMNSKKIIKKKQIEITDAHYESLDILKEYFYNVSKSKGFHSSKKINFGDFISNLHGEISELWEAYRANILNKPCDKSEKMETLFGESLTCAEEEVADVLIRLLDIACTLKINLARAVKLKTEYNKTRPYRHGNKKA